VQKAALEEQISGLEQKALQAMMNPHFIFNVMNSIQHYINGNDRQAANLYLSDFAALVRMNLEISNKSFISLFEEIAYLRLYLSLESLRFKNRLDYAISIDPEIDEEETTIPVMVLQPFVENAILHGVVPLTETGLVQINITKENDDLMKVQIIDNGVGYEHSLESKSGSKHISRGMKLTRQRLELIGRRSGQQCYVEVKDARQVYMKQGTVVEILLPMNISGD
jgi:LytS/YehU family sensor histidine kinase